MNELSDTDWELINAYHDGELADTECQALEARLASEPALREALEEIADLSSSLAGLRPDTQQTYSQEPPTPANRNHRLARWLIGGAVAAALALAVALGPQFYAVPSALDIHADLSAKPIAADAGAVRQVTADGSRFAPDLDSANLTPVTMQQLKDGHVTHYAGRNGCRLSYFRGDFNLGEYSPTSKNQVAEWSNANDVRHMIVATGMDQDKFNAIAAYLMLSTRQQAADQMMASLVEKTANADRCVG